MNISSTPSPAVPAFDLVVTRHAGLVQFLTERGLIPPGTPTVAHATAEAVAGKHVLGVLPLNLAAHAASVTEATLALRPDQRGRELTAAETAEAFQGLATYRVARL